MLAMIFYAEQHSDGWRAVTFFDGSKWEKGPFVTLAEAEKSCQKLCATANRDALVLKARHLQTLKNN